MNNNACCDSAEKQPQNTLMNRLKRFIFNPQLAIFLIFIVICIIFSLLSPVFLTGKNWINIARQVVTVGILSVGMSFVIISGEIDLSVGSIVGFSGMVIARLFTDGISLISVIIILFALGAVIGFLNGIIVTRIRIPSFLVTLSTSLIFRGFAMAMTPGSVPMSMPNETFNNIFAQATLLNFIPSPFLILLGLVIVASFILNRTVFGKYVYAVGGSANAANLAGINVKWIKTWVFCISGLFASICGGVYAARIGAAITTGGEGFELDAIAAVVLGGTKFSGGSGKIWGSIFGSLIICTVSNALTLMGIATAWRSVVQGCIIILAVAIDVWIKRD